MIYFGVKTFEDSLDNRHFILKTDNGNLTYLNATLTGKVQRWKLYLQEKDHVPGKEVHQFIPNASSCLCDNHMPAKESKMPAHKRHQAFLATIEPKNRMHDVVFFNKLLRYTTPWSATGDYRSAGSVSMILQSQTAQSPSSYANTHAAKS